MKRAVPRVLTSARWRYPCRSILHAAWVSRFPRRRSQEIPMSLEGKRIAITGAFGSLGAAVVEAALAVGAEVAAIDRADAPAPGVDLGTARRFGGVDLADTTAAKTAIDAAAEA